MRDDAPYLSLFKFLDTFTICVSFLFSPQNMNGLQISKGVLLFPKIYYILLSTLKMIAIIAINTSMPLLPLSTWRSCARTLNPGLLISGW